MYFFFFFPPSDLEGAADAAIERRNEGEISTVLSHCSPATDRTLVERLNRAKLTATKKWTRTSCDFGRCQIVIRSALSLSSAHSVGHFRGLWACVMKFHYKMHLMRRTLQETLWITIGWKKKESMSSSWIHSFIFTKTAVMPHFLYLLIVIHRSWCLYKWISSTSCLFYNLESNQL